jgi:hypothetical protein
MHRNGAQSDHPACLPAVRPDGIQGAALPRGARLFFPAWRYGRGLLFELSLWLSVIRKRRWDAGEPVRMESA